MRAFASRRLFGLGVRLAAIAALPFRRGRFTKAPFTARFTTWRSAPALPLRPARAHGALHASRAAIARTEATGRRVTLFMQCVSDRVAPEVVLATADLLRAAGCEVDIPEAQHCCGLPAIDSGDDANARRMARQTLEVLAGADDVVTPAPSCAIAMLHDYERLFEDEPVWQERARRLSGRVYDLTGYLVGPARLPDGVLARGDTRPVAIDRFCQGANVLGRGDTLETLVRGLTGANVVPLAEAEVCCGFGGSTSVLAPDLSRGVLERKLDNVRASGARVLLTDNPGCLLHLGGGADAADMDVTVMHVAEYLAARLPGR